MIETTQLGTQGLVVSRQGLGCMGMSEFYGASDDAESLATIQRALDLGVTFFDTSDMYGPHTNEELLGRAISGRRDDAVVATKFGIVRTDDGAYRGSDGSAAYAKQACEASLRRLGIDAIDLYYLHRVDPKTPIEETVGGMGELVAEGKVRFIGLSEVAPETIRRAHAVHPLTAVQTEYSLWERSVEETVLPTLRELGIGLVPYSPLGRGFLTGAFASTEELDADDWRRTQPRLADDNLEANRRIAERIREVAEEHGATPAQVALAWVHAQGDDVVPIPGTKRRRYLEDNAAALDVVLGPDDLRRLEEVGTASGDRYADMSSIER